MCAFLTSIELPLVKPRPLVAESTRPAESEEIAIQESNKICIWAPVLNKDFREGSEERHPRLKLYQSMKIIENILKSKMENFTKPMAGNAQFHSKLLKSVWVGQAQEKHHHTNISRKLMAMFTANSKNFAIQTHGGHQSTKVRHLEPKPHEKHLSSGVASVPKIIMAAPWIKTLRRIKVAWPETMQIIIKVHYCEQCQDDSVYPAAISVCRVPNQKQQKHLKTVNRLRH